MEFCIKDRMNKFACLLLLLTLSTAAFSKEKNYFGYGDVSAMGSHPMVGVGLRSKNGIHAFDVSGHIMPWNRFSPFIFHMKGVYLFYPAQEGFYCGSGLGFLNEPHLKSVTGSIEASLGYQSRNADNAPMFFEANLIAPFLEPQGTMRVWPGLTLGYGF